MAINTDAVQRLYLAYFNRPSDPIGQAYWESKLPATAATQAQLTTLAAGFSGSTEYTALYAGQSNAQIINNLYLNLFGRAAETAGLTSWALALTNGTQTFASIALQLTYSAQGTDATAIANKLSAANSFTTSLVTSAQITGYSGTAAAASARTWLATVTDVASTLTSATATTTLSAAVTAATAAGTSSTGTTFTLTTGADNIVGTANNDTVNSALVDKQTPANTTLSAVDTLTGGAGTDVLNIITQGTTAIGDAANGATISGFETINIRAIDTGGGTTFAASSDMTSVNSNLSTAALTVSNLVTGASGGMIGNGTLTNGALTLGYLGTATGASTLNVSGGTTGGNVVITGTGIASTVINSTGSTANIIGTLTNAATSKSITINAATGITIGALGTGTDTTITVTGAAATAATPVVPAANDITSAVQIGALTAAVTTIDASAMTAGGVSATMIAGITSFKGGAGTDTVTTAALTSTLPSIIDAGAGTDVLRLGAYAHVNTATLAKQYANFEILDGMALTGTAIDMSLFTNSTITGIRAGAGAAESFSNVTATQAANVTIYGSEATTTTFAIVGAGTSGQIDTLKLTFDDGLVAKNTYTLASLVAAGVENINIVANDNATISLMTGSTAWTNSTITGAGAVSITTGALAANANTTIDASALTGAFTFVGTGTTANGYKVTGSATKVDTLTGSTLADTLIGGTANDTFNVSISTSGNDTLTGGGGNDTFAFGAAALGATPSATNFVTITDYVKAAGSNFDTISATALILGVQTAAAGAGVATITAGVATFNAADTTFAQHLTAVEAAIQQTAAGATAIWQEGANSYVFIQTAGAGVSAGDMLIQLTGVTAGALTVSGNAITAMA